MAAEKESANREFGVNIEIGGNVGPASAVGRNNRVEAQNVAGGNIVQRTDIDRSEQEKFLTLIQDLRTQISRLEKQFDSDDAKDVEERLVKVAQFSAKEKPPVERIKRDLETVREIVKGASTAGAAVGPLLTLVQQAWESFHHLFGL